MLPGFDYLGMAHPRFPFARIKQITPRDRPIGYFWEEFGPMSKKASSLLQAGFLIHRPQMYWPGSGHQLVAPSVIRPMLQQLKKVMDPYKDQVKLYVSPSCEHGEKSIGKVKDILEMVRDVISYAIPVNSVMTKENSSQPIGAIVPGFLTEKHGSHCDGADLVSTDGENIYDINSMQWLKEYANREHPCFIWGYRYNLREIPDPGQKVPTISQRKAAPDNKYLASMKRIALPVEPAPKPTFEDRPFSKPNIYKTHAEDDQEENEDTPDEYRENRPVLIIKSSAASVDIITFDDKPVGTKRYGAVGSFPGGLTRYYSGIAGAVGLYGYEIGAKAQKISGSEWVWIKDGRTISGPIHPAFRAGVFR